MKTNTYYFVLYSNTSRCGPGGLKPRVAWTSGVKIISCAAEELARSGEALAEGLTPADELASSAEKLGDDGRMYEIFPTDAAGAAAFVEAAAAHYLDDKARAIVEDFNA